MLDGGARPATATTVKLTNTLPAGVSFVSATPASGYTLVGSVLTFTNLGNVPFAQKTTLKVDVKPVPGEHNTSNNMASYPVIFSLG